MKRTLVLLAILVAISVGSIFAMQDSTKASAMPKDENKSEMSTPMKHGKKVAQHARRHHKSKKVEQKKDAGTTN